MPTPSFRLWILLMLLAGAVVPVSAADSGVALEDFEAGYDAHRWSFSHGAEFPGAQGSFSRATDAAHSGEFGGKLAFDFAGGGRYVAASIRLPDPSPATSNPWNALRLWLKRPDGNEFTFRSTDATGQTFQKSVDCPADRWTQVTIPFSDWTGHWGGPNDGQLRGQPRTLALLVENSQQPTGAMLFDDLRLVNHQVAVARVSYPAYQFTPGEGWHARADGPAGATQLAGATWSLDFSQGARAISLTVPDHVLLGSVDKLRLRVRGSAQGHPVRLVLHTHFMTFHKVIGEFVGEGDQELVTDGPPGPGWEWHSGENDGKLHGPLRLGEIQLAANGHADRCTLELRELAIDARCPEEKRCVLLVDTSTENDRPGFLVRMRAVADTPLAGELSWILRDWEGREVGQGKQAVTLPPQTVAAKFSVPLTQSQIAGRKFLEAEFSLTISGQEVPSVKGVWLAPREHQGNTTLRPESPFGMGVYLNRYGGDTQGLALMERAAQLARAAGVKWSREDFSWGRLERERGKFDWTYYDQLLACAKRNGITVYAIVGYWTSWTKPYTAEGIDDYVQFVKALVGRYHKDVKQWEIWNEPNIFFWQGPQDMYAELLAKSYAAIKELDPEAQVLGLSTAGIDTKFIDRMLALKAPFDILTIHPYRSHLNDQAFIGDLQKVSDQVRLPDGRRRPVWLTELGWATHTPHNTLKQDFAPNSLRTQAELIARSYLCAIVSGVEPRTFWYDFRNDGDDPIYFEHQMGIVDHDFRPKPAYVAYATLTQVLEGKSLDRQLETRPGVFAFRFKPLPGSPGNVLAVWSPLTDARVELPVSVERVTRVNTVGERSELKAVGGNVSVDLNKGAAVYLLLP